jgi:hypothetical protein
MPTSDETRLGCSRNWAFFLTAFLAARAAIISASSVWYCLSELEDSTWVRFPFRLPTCWCRKGVAHKKSTVRSREWAQPTAGGVCSKRPDYDSPALSKPRDAYEQSVTPDGLLIAPAWKINPPDHRKHTFAVNGSYALAYEPCRSVAA